MGSVATVTAFSGCRLPASPQVIPEAALGRDEVGVSSTAPARQEVLQVGEVEITAPMIICVYSAGGPTSRAGSEAGPRPQGFGRNARTHQLQRQPGDLQWRRRQGEGRRKTLGAAMSKAKTPLIVGGTAVAGVAAGAVARGRLRKRRSKNPLARLRALSVPKPSLDKLDLETVKSAADRVTAYGKQASDMASALEKTKKKHG